MKHTHLFLTGLIAVLLLAGCSNPTDSDDALILQGTFNGKAFTFVSGYAEASILEPDAYELIFCNIKPLNGLSPWESEAYPVDDPYLSIGTTVPARVGTTKLVASGGEENRWVLLIDRGDPEGLKTIPAYTGSVEITSIDKEKGTLSGRMSASGGEGNEVNGTFTIPIAPKI